VLLSILGYCVNLVSLSNNIAAETVIKPNYLLFQAMRLNPLAVSPFQNDIVKVVSMGDACATEIDQVVEAGRDGRKDVGFLAIFNQFAHLSCQLILLFFCFSLLCLFALLQHYSQLCVVYRHRSIHAVQETRSKVLPFVGMEQNF